jgi:hypothetical protein
MKLITPNECLRPPALKLFEKQEGLWVLEPKLDGSYCELEIDARGHAYYTTSSGLLFSKKVLKNLDSVVWRKELYNSSFVCEIETHTHWSVERSAKRGFVIGHVHTLLSHDGEDATKRSYRENISHLRELMCFFDERIFFPVRRAYSSFESAYERYKKEVCYEGAVLKRLDMCIVPPRNGRLKHWYKIKDFGT